MTAEEIERIAADWISQKTSGHWTEIDEARLAEWIAANLSHRIAYIRLESVWKSAERLKVLGAGMADSAIPPRGSWNRQYFLSASAPDRKGNSSSPEPPRRFTGWRGATLLLRTTHTPLLTAAALVLTAFAIGIFVQFNQMFGYHGYTTSIGRTDLVPLADGSHATLNTNSSIRVDLRPDERRIELDHGEAFFDVAKDPQRPFVVTAGERRVIAVGTKFSVRLEGNDIRVAVVEGKVRIEGPSISRHDKSAGEEVVLAAGAVAQTAGTEVAIQENDASQVEQLLSWRRGYLIFRDTTIGDAVAEFNRYNARQIVIEDPAIATIRIGGKFRADNTDTFLWMLQKGFPIAAEMSATEVVLRHR